MKKIIGVALIVLALAGCAGGAIPGDTAWSRDYLKTNDSKNQRAY